jgi:hypothetical protein
MRIFNQSKTMQEGEMNDASEKVVQSMTDKLDNSRQLLEEIRELESKILEVNKVLYRHSLDHTIRFQLKGDLEYYQQTIEKKRQQLRQWHEEH